MEKSLPIKPSPIDERDFILESINPRLSNELPETFNMSRDFGPARDQGSDRTCAAFTAACIKERHERHNIGAGEYMSPQFVYDNRVNQDTSGMYSRDVMKILNKIGILPENEFPYHSYTEISQTHLETASKYRIKGYGSIHTIDALKESLYNNGPALISVPVYNYGKHMWKPEGSQQMLGGHAMAIMGWNAEGFIIRNSWGTKWQSNGYTVFPYTHWGMQWEIWTAVDADDAEIGPIIDDKKNKEENKKGLIRRFFDWLLSLFT